MSALYMPSLRWQKAVIPAFSGVAGTKKATKSVLCSEQGSRSVLAPHTVP